MMTTHDDEPDWLLERSSMGRPRPLTIEEAQAVFNVLRDVAGAGEWQRDEFVTAMLEYQPPEHSFGGSLGAGGKFWNEWNWYVTAYPEDMEIDPEKLHTVNRTNL